MRTSVIVLIGVFMVCMFSPAAARAQNVINDLRNSDTTVRYDFEDGNFDVYGKLEKNMLSNKFFQNTKSELIRNVREHLKEQSQQLNYPWIASDQVKVVNDTDNYLAEVTIKGGSIAYLGQDITFRKKPPAISFTVFVKKAHPKDTLEVVLTDIASGEELRLHSYKLSDLGSSQRITLRPWNNYHFSRFMQDPQKPLANISFKIQGNSRLPTTVRLDDFRITY